MSKFKKFKIDNVKLSVPQELLTDDIERALRQGWYEAEEAEMLASIIQPDEVIMEIGGGIGLVSTICAQSPMVKSIHTFEANPQLIPVMKETHKLNNVNVEVYNEIVSRKDGMSKFYLHDSFWASSLIKWEGAKEVDVKMTRFQDRLEEIKPSLLIVDIEGGELELFDFIDLSGVKKIFIELHQNTIGREGMLHVFEVLARQNFHYDQWHSKGAVILFSLIDRDRIVSRK